MKNSAFLFLFVCLIGNSLCAQNLSAQNNQRQINEWIKGKKLYIRDSSLYSPSFINDLRQLYSQYDSLKVIDDTLYISSVHSNGRKLIHALDSYPLPAELPLDKVVHYKAEQEGKKYILNLKRINYTDIEFEFKMNGQTIKSGRTILPGYYILGAECGPDENGVGYCSNQYFSKEHFNKPDCTVRLTVEIKSRKRVSFGDYCSKDDGDIKDIPILKRE